MENNPLNIRNKFFKMLLLFLLGSCRGGFSSKDLSGEYWYANPGNPYQVIESKKNNNYRNKIYPKVTDYVFDHNFIIAEQTPDSVAFMLSLGEDLMRRFEHYELYNNNNKILEDSFYSSGYETTLNFFITVDPDVFKKYLDYFSVIENIVSSTFYQFTKVRVTHVEVKVDLDKFQIVGNRIISILTPWEEINKDQDKLIQNFERSSDSIDFQNLGNTARTIMNKLADQVFDKEKHKPKDITKDIQNGKFKNQLHAFIDNVLSGSKNAEFRKLAESSIEIVERSIDFMNSTTHKLNASKHLAEVCVISTISAVSIIKLVKELE